MNNSNMLNHLKTQHKDLFIQYKKKDEASKALKRKAEEEKDASGSALKNKQQKHDYLQQT